MHFCFQSFNSGDYERTVAASVTINESSFLCKENFVDTRTIAAVKNPTAHGTDTNDSGTGSATASTVVPIIYFVTPTYPRREQFAEIIRLGQTLMHVPHLHWIVADDTDSCNQHLDEFLNRFGKLMCFYLFDTSFLFLRLLVLKLAFKP